MHRLLWISLVLAGCSGSPDLHSYSVASSQVSTANNKCGADAIRTGQFTPAGEPIRFWMPCWDLSKGGARYEVNVDRGTRAKLAQAERTHCIGLLPAALERSPFVMDKAIDEVVPHRSGTEIRGAHVVLKPMPGLTVSWMRRAIACHQARWRALGRPTNYLPGDPTLVDGVEIKVSEWSDHIVVLISTESAKEAKVVIARAEELEPPERRRVQRRQENATWVVLGR